MKKSENSIYGMLILGATLVLIELALRCFGIPGWRMEDRNSPAESWITFDDKFGWKNQPGSWKLKDLSTVREFSYDFDENGVRASGSAVSPLYEVSFIGDSYVQGYGLREEETFISQLQRRFPSIRLKNHGVAGYGTYQSLLKAREILSNENPPAHIYYLFNSFHELRNSGDLSYLRWLNFAAGSYPDIPCAKLDKDGEIIEMRVQGRTYWLLSDYSALVALFDELYYLSLRKLRAQEATDLTEKLIQQIAIESTSHHAKFTVILFDMPIDLANEYSQRLSNDKINFIDCSSISRGDRSFRQEDGHPNSQMSSQIADCLANGLAHSLN
jgi:hypothetical protein